MSSIQNFARVLLLASCFSATSVSMAQAQAVKETWGFQQQNRVSVASLIRQVEKDKSNGTGTTVAAAGTTTVINCAKGTASSEANSTCIIMNNSDGLVNVDQDSEGDQSASNEQTVTGSDDVLAALQGN